MFANQTKKTKVYFYILCCVIISPLIYSCANPDQSSESLSKQNSTNTSTDATESINWNTFKDEDAAAFIQRCKQNYVSAETLFKGIESLPRSTDQLLKELNEFERLVSGEMGHSSLFANVHPNAEVREAAEHCEQNLTVLVNELSLSQATFQKVAAIDLNLYTGEDKRYILDTLIGFKRSGVNLKPDDRARVKTLNEEINLIGQIFQKNIRDDVRTIELPKNADLSGLPQDFIENHINEETGGYTISTSYPDYFPIIQYANNDVLRKALYLKFKNRGNPKNKEVLLSLFKKRHELAQLLGYENYAEYVTEIQMIKNPKKAQDFIDSISEIAKKQSEQEYQELLERLKKIDPSASYVSDWQKTYLSELIKKEKYQVDSKEIRQYFQYNKVRQGVFDLTESLFGVSIRPWETEVWDESVEAFEMYDGDKLIGQFYLDMHPREGKYKHAAAFTVQDGILGQQLPIKALVCNFPKGNELMEHKQVETYLHEFGHLLHGIFGGHQKWISQSGIKTEHDFVEAPSQMLEEWVWDANTLKQFATNKNGEAIPDALIEKMKAARDFGHGLFARHQMFYAALSLNYYDQAPSEFNDDELSKVLQNRYSNFNYVDDTHFQYSFGHLFGYSAVYYTYMWSLVIADDMFSEFERQGLNSKDVAQRYRDKVLAPGGTKDAEELVTDFLGRPYTFEAFSKRLQ